MNVLFLQPALPLYRVPFFERLHAQGWSVTVWSDFDSTLHAGAHAFDFTAAHRPEHQLGPFISQPALHEAVRSNWADVVVLSWNTRYVQLLPALLEARMRNKAVVLWGHGYSKNERPVRRRFRNRLGQLATACVTYSESARARLLTEGYDAARVFTAPNALHDGPLRFAIPASELNSPDANRTRNHGGNTILFVSRLEADKQPTLLIDAFAFVRAEVPDAKLVVVGKGSQQRSIERRITELGLRDAVTLTGAIYDERQLAPLFLESKVFAYPTAIGLSLLHAFSYGVPVVTSEAAERHNPEFESLIPNVNGLTYADGDVRDFAHQLVRVLTNSELRATLSRGAVAAVTPPHGTTLTAMTEGMRKAIEYARSTRSR